MSDDLPTKSPASAKKRRLTKLRDLSRWRRLSVGMYTTPTSAEVYGRQDLDASEVLALIAELREKTGVRVGIVHVMAKIVGDLLSEYPHFNVLLRRRKFFQRPTSDVFLQVAIKEGKGDLGGIRIKSVDEKSVLELAKEVADKAARVRAREDQELEKSKASLERVPALLMPGMVRFLDILSNDVGMNLSWLGVRPDAWGGAMVSNIGSFGLPHGYAPLVFASRVPILVLLGAVEDRPVVRDGEVVIRPILTITGTFDHRIFDGMQLAKVTTFVKARFEQPDWLRAELE